MVFINDEDHVCEIDTIYSTEHLTCITPPATNLPKNVPQDVLGIGRIQEESSCSGDCTFTYEDGHSPVINSISSTGGGTGAEVSVFGTGFGLEEQNATVLIGGTRASILLISDNEIKFEVPALACGDKTFYVTILDQGTATLNLPSNF